MNTTRSGHYVVLMPGLWLGGWAWDEVAGLLAAAGLRVSALTLPGLESRATPRGGIRLADHVEALVAALRATRTPATLVAHSGAGAIATAALDRAPGLVRRVVYVDSGPVADGAVARPDLPPETIEVPLPPFPELEAAGSSLAGLSRSALRRFRERAVPHPAGPLREPVRLGGGEGVDVPTTIVCCSFPGEAVRRMAAEGVPFFAPLAGLSDVTYVDLPTGHWPMWSTPHELAEVIAEADRG